MYTVEHLFPIPLYRTKLEYTISDEEFNHLKELKYFRRSGFNLSSENTRVLDNQILSSLKSELEKHLNILAKEVLNYTNDFFITNSWININPPGTFHKSHNHVNSILSGVYYIRIPDNSPPVSFSKPVRPELLLEPVEWNSYNSSDWKINVLEGELLIFPSNLQHEVLPNHSMNDRVSLAFNSFIKGTIGSDNNSDRLDFSV